MVTVQINTTIPSELQRALKDHGIKYSYCMRRGYMAITGDNQLKDRLTELEEDNQKMQKKLTFYAQRVMQLEEKFKDQLKDEKIMG